MIIVKVPLRIPFFSGGSDLPAFFEKEPGAALSCTIDKYVRVIVHQTDEPIIRYLGEKNEIITDLGWMQHDITRETLNYFGIDKGLTITSINDINHRGTGLGSSSAYTVGLVMALHKIKFNGVIEKPYLADLACEIEIERCGFPIGKQDQYAATYGGMRLWYFNPHKGEDWDLFDDDYNDLEKNLFLVNSDITRISSGILINFKVGIGMDEKKFELAKEGRDLAYVASDCIRDKNFDEIGQLFNRSWQKKKAINKNATTDRIDEIYDTCMLNGATGGKLLGAGGGGFMLFYVPKDNQVQFLYGLASLGLTRTPFKFVYEGAKIIHED